MTRNPYSPSTPSHTIHCRVSADHYSSFKTLLPFHRSTDAVLSSLFHSFITQLLTHVNPSVESDRAWYATHPTYSIVARLLGQPAGEHSGEAGARDEQRGTGAIHQGLCGPTLIRPESQSGVEQGSLIPRRGEREENQGQEKRQRESSGGTPEGVARLMDQLKGIL